MTEASSSKEAQEESKEIRRASGIFAFFTLVSRILGLVRNQLLSHYFGAGPLADAFIAAFTIPNAFRRLFGEGALTPAIVSLLTRAKKEKGDDGISFISNAFYWLTIALIFLCVVGIVISPWLVDLYVHEYKLIPGKFELTVQLTRVLFPFLLFIAWFAFFMGVLNTYRSFGSAAAGPAVMNVTVIIVSVVGLSFAVRGSEHGILIFALANLVGGLTQALIQIPWLKKFHAYPRWQFHRNDPRVIELAKMLLPSILSMGVYQINILINRRFASGIEGAVSHLYYSDLLLELPVAIVATSIGTAVVPSFSRLIADKNEPALVETFQYAARSISVLSFPATAGLMALALPIISSIFYTGAFTAHDASIAADTLICYAVGLPFFSLLRIVVPVYFAEKDTLTPSLFGIIALAVNFLAAWQLAEMFGASGIALSTSLSSIVNVLLLIFVVQRRHPQFFSGKLFLDLLKIGVSAAAMAGVLILIRQSFAVEVWFTRGITMEKLVNLGVLLFAGTVTFFVVAHMLGIQSARDIVLRFSSKLRAKR